MYVCKGVKMFLPDVGHGAFNILPGYFLEYVIYAVSGLPLSAVVSPAIFAHIQQTAAVGRRLQQQEQLQLYLLNLTSCPLFQPLTASANKISILSVHSEDLAEEAFGVFVCRFNIQNKNLVFISNHIFTFQCPLSSDVYVR